MISAWLGIAFVLASLLGLIAGLGWYERKSHPHPEVLRKLLHVIMGSVTISFPWLFHETWAVCLLAVLSASLLAFIKYVPRLRTAYGSVLCSANRKTYGELCFPAAVAILFALAHHEPLFYCVPLSILALADALSALIGIFHGKHRYTTADGYKTMEGSFSFFLVSALTTYGGLTLHGSDPALSLAIACLIGCLVTAFEAIAWRGLDNLIIPMSAFVLLKTSINEPLAMLIQQLVIAVILMTVAVCCRAFTTLNDGAALGAGLFSYLSWAVGGLLWLIPPFTAFVAYTLLMPRKYRNLLHAHSIHEVVLVAAVGFLWLFLSKVLDAPLLLVPYTLSYAMHTSLLGSAHVCIPQRFGKYKFKVILYVPLATSIFFLTPMLALNVFGQSTLSFTYLSVAFVYLSTLSFCLWYRTAGQVLSTASRWAKQTSIVALSSALALVPLLIQ